MEEDRQIWIAICRGDEAAFQRFYEANAPRLQAFLRQIVQDRQAAEDLSQEAFIQFWNKPHAFDPERGSLRTWLFGIGRKLASEWWRHQKPSDPIKDRSGVTSVENRSLLEDAFQQLPAEQRALLWLREVEGYSYAELASALGVPIGTVRSRLFSVRESLRQIWNRDRFPSTTRSS